MYSQISDEPSSMKSWDGASNGIALNVMVLKSLCWYVTHCRRRVCGFGLTGATVGSLSSLGGLVVSVPPGLVTRNSMISRISGPSPGIPG